MMVMLPLGLGVHDITGVLLSMPAAHAAVHVICVQCECACCHLHIDEAHPVELR